MTQTFTRQPHPAELVKNRASAESLGLNSSSPEWMHECEVRRLALMDTVSLESFLRGAVRHRGVDMVFALESEVAARRVAMDILHIDHPYINMRLYAQAGLAPVVATDVSKRDSNQAAQDTEVEQKIPDAVIEQEQEQAEVQETTPPRRSLFHR